ncbi:hypothetical protein [Kineosporia sp. R_H_3]|uniref:hypothetical protein n=1 Tax=Kineosporia sp. R_H_3 TaxID=1961848 RepID=UPI00117A6682|nr:hypothetical protein [Kineosporia sp. R_H_3]
MLQVVVGGPVVTVCLALAVLAVAAARMRSARHRDVRRHPDLAETLLSAVAALTDDRPPDGADAGWGAATCAELASVTGARERLSFAVGASIALIGASPRRLGPGLVAVLTALSFAASLLAFSRATVGESGVGAVTVLVPPVLLFAIAFTAAWWHRSLRSGLESGVLAGIATWVATAAVLGFEGAHWFQVTHLSVLDGEFLDATSSRAAAFDAVHPVILLVHLLVWLPWPVLGAIVGILARHRRPAPA